MIKRHSIILFLSLILLSLVFLTQANASCRMTGDALDTSNGVTNPVFDEGAARDACSAVPDTYKLNALTAGSIINNDVAGAAQIAQSKLNLNAATTRADATGISQSDLGSASFDSAKFTVTNGWVTIASGSTALVDIENIGSGNVIGRSAVGSGTVSETMRLLHLGQFLMQVQ